MHLELLYNHAKALYKEARGDAGAVADPSPPPDAAAAAAAAAAAGATRDVHPRTSNTKAYSNACSFMCL